MPTQIPTTDDIRAVVQQELSAFFASNKFQPQPEQDEIGGVELAARVTGLAIPTIYTKAHRRELPYSKPEGSKKLVFSKRDLETWLRTGKRKTVAEITTAQIN